MQVSKSELLKALQRALPGVETGSSLLEGADTFIFKDKFCYTYNDSISVRVPIPVELTGAVKANEFFKLLSKLASDEMEIEVTETTWNIKCGSAEVEMSLLQAGIIAQIQQLVPGEGWDSLPEDFMNGIAECKFNSNRSSLSGVFIEGFAIFSTDEIRINRYKIDKEMQRFWISDNSASELLKLPELAEYVTDKTWVHFRTVEGAIFSIKRLSDAKFPIDKLGQVIAIHEPIESDTILTLPTTLKEAVDRASTLSMNIDSQDSVQLTLSKEGINVSTSRSTGKFKEDVPWGDNVPEDFTTVSVYIDYAMIAYGLKRSQQLFSRCTEGSTGNKVYRLVFHSEKVIHIISTKSAE